MNPAVTHDRTPPRGSPGPLTGVDPWRLFANAPTDRAVLWREPGADEVTVGIGTAAEVTSRSPAVRFAEIADALAGELEGAPVTDRWFGGFAFDCHDDTDPMWSDHPCGALTLPACTVVVTPSGEADVAVRDPLRSPDVERIVTASNATAGPAPLVRTPDRAADAYLDLVAAAIARIDGGALQKVVLARRAPWTGTPDVATILSDLARRQPSCAVFAFRRGSRVFLGATPELLLAHGGAGRVRSDALAGSRPRGDDAAGDELLAAELAGDSKERMEHRYVVDDIRRQLDAAGVVVDPPAATVVRRLEGIQHLHTPVTGTLDARAGHLVEILGALHPSPAVCGTPTSTARHFIRRHEGMDRGWYAGPVGWIDGRGAASFHVALRSGLVELDTRRTHLFAGAGIVAGSRPEAELAETEVKLRALGRSLGS